MRGSDGATDKKPPEIVLLMKFSLAPKGEKMKRIESVKYLSNRLNTQKPL
jgi:hypothetical protein